MTPQTFILFGPSGSGKGTQANLLIDYLKEKDPEKNVFYMETGQKVRELSKHDSLTGKLTKEVIESGGLMPEFVPVYLWSQFLIENVAGNEHLVFDGLCRRQDEPPVFDSAMKFYKRELPFIISINVSDNWATEKLLGRGRGDDNEEDIRNRLIWYKDHVLSAINFFKDNPYYKFIEINGEQSIEEVHQEILGKIGL